MSALADGLELDRFAVIGVSGGGPFKAACALKIPQRLTGAAIVSGVGPLDVPGATDGMMRSDFFLLVRRALWLARLLLILMARGLNGDLDRLLSRMMAAAPPPADKAVLAQPEVEQMLIDSIREAFHSGARGAAWDVALIARPWRFQLQEISMEVHLWHGELDVNAPPITGRYQANAIPSCTLTAFT